MVALVRVGGFSQIHRPGCLLYFSEELWGAPLGTSANGSREGIRAASGRYIDRQFSAEYQLRITTLRQSA